MKTPKQIAQAALNDSYLAMMDNPEGTLAIIVAAIEADRAQRFEVPMPLSGVIEATEGGVFVNDRGDYLVEPAGDETLELILVRADGTTATATGEWEMGWNA